MKRSLNDDDSSPLVVVKSSHRAFFRDHLLEVFLVSLYFAVSTILPIYNKKLSLHYDFPMTATTLQVAGALVALAIFHAIHRYTHHNDLVPKSWLFNSLFLWKSLVTLPVSILFALVISLTNISIFITPIDVHVLLKSTNIIWIVIFAWIIEREVPRIPVIICVCGLIGGTILISYQFTKGIESPAKKIIINLASFFCEAITIVVLKKIVGVLKAKEPTIAAPEITLTKMGQALILLLLPTYLIEGSHGLTRLTSSDMVYILVAIGVLITVLYQTTVVGLTFFSLATTLGVLGQIQILPQTGLAILFFHSFSVNALHIVGAVLVLVFTMIFGVLRYYENRTAYNKTHEFLIATHAYGSHDTPMPIYEEE